MAPHKDFESQPESVRDVRRFIAESLPDTPRLDDIVLAGSELSTNVIRHAQTDYTVSWTADSAKVRLEVSDGSSIIPAVEDLADNKRGLRLIEALSDRWGIESTETGKTIWAEFLTR